MVQIVFKRQSPIIDTTYKLRLKINREVDYVDDKLINSLLAVSNTGRAHHKYTSIIYKNTQM